MINLTILFFICVGPLTHFLVNSEPFYYYAYGSNLLAKRIHINNPTAVFYKAAKLKDYRLDFNLQLGKWNGAVATIVSEAGSVVWGALWVLDSSQISHLDEQEGVTNGWYYAKNVTVTTEDEETLIARTYQETSDPDKVPDEDHRPINRRPSITYLEVIIFGAIESKIPANYIGYLISFLNNHRYADCKRRKELEYPFL